MIWRAGIVHDALRHARFRLRGATPHGCNPRPARRGYMLPVAALGLTIWAFTLSFSYQLLLQEARQARAEAMATLISDLAADFDLYVHQNQTALASAIAAASLDALTLSASETSTFLESGGAGSWRMPILGLANPGGSVALSLTHIDVSLGIACRHNRSAN